MTDPPTRRGDASLEGPRVFPATVLALAATYAFLRFGLPWLSVALGLSEVPAPTPAFALAVYMLCAVVGSLVYVSSDERRWRGFLGPMVRLFALAPGPGRRVRLLVLTLLPVAAGWLAWRQLSPETDVATAIRLQHPTQPADYAALESPLSVTEQEAYRAGMVLYQKNCRPCHGAAATGDGPLARGLRLRPVDFTDGGAIASVVESYPFWRVSTGHAGLPDIATPWSSAMPAWRDELTEEEIWRIVATEYRLSRTEPRRPEGASERPERPAE